MLGLKANIRDVRDLDYNIRAEEAKGNMSKRMMELQTLMEMQSQGFPVDPMQIIEKMELPESEKQRWSNFIQQSQQAQQQEKQRMVAKEVEFKERELAEDERETTLKFITDMAKVKQMGEKDEKSMVTNFAKMSLEEKRDIMQFAQQVAQIAQAAQAAEEEMEQDGKKARQELGQDAAAHNQDMRFAKEKQALDLKAAKAKQVQDMQFAKAKAAQAKKVGGNNGKSNSGKR